MGPQAIQTWLHRDDIIAPHDYERDIASIAEVTQNAELGRRLNECFAAIPIVRSAHLRASFHLAKQVRAAAIHLLSHREGLASLGGDVVLARVRLIDTAVIPVRTSLVNRWREDL